MKSVREYYAQCLESETPTFVRVLEAVPPEKADYRPHPRSMSAQEIVWLLTTEMRDCCEVIDRGEVTWVHRAAPGVSEAIEAYKRHAAELASRVQTLDDTRWEANARFLVDGNVAWETSLGNMLFGFLFDAVHHRGQLSTYLRPMGAKVPSIYGPSGDDPGR